jgi:hypothetical protein
VIQKGVGDGVIQVCLIARFEVPTSVPERVSSRLAQRSAAVANWRSGNTCSADGYHIERKDLDKHIARQGLEIPCQRGSVIASPLHSCVGCRWRL